MKYVNLNWLQLDASLHQTEYQISDEPLVPGAPDFYGSSPTHLEDLNDSKKFCVDTTIIKRSKDYIML